MSRRWRVSSARRSHLQRCLASPQHCLVLNFGLKTEALVLGVPLSDAKTKQQRENWRPRQGKVWHGEKDFVIEREFRRGGETDAGKMLDVGAEDNQARRKMNQSYLNGGSNICRPAGKRGHFKNAAFHRGSFVNMLPLLVGLC